MSGFLVRAKASDWHVNAECGDRHTSAIAFAKKGMQKTLSLQGEGFELELFRNASHDPAQSLAREANGQFCTFVGTLIYKGQTGLDASAALLRDIRLRGIDCLDSAIGNYCVLIGDQRDLQILIDRAGLHHVYHSEDLSLVTNSFIAAAAVQPKQKFETQEVLEYVLLGATFGQTTMVRGIRLLDCESVIRIQNGHRESMRRKSVWRNDSDDLSRITSNERLARTIESAESYYEQVVRAFGAKVTSALSGGYDSRLSLALLLKQGIRPALFVYGAPTDLDVKVAKLICLGEGLEIVHHDRADRPVLEPDDYWLNQEDVFHGLDGLTQYGFACEPFEVNHRRERVSGGLIAINGGGGEIWRDFWKLPDRPMTVDEFVGAYFSGRFDGLASSDYSPKRLLRLVAEKVRHLLGVAHERVSSPIIQSLYPRMRLRFWQGKNNSVDNMIGFAVTPFSEHHFSVPAMWIPLGSKRNGWFERQLIRRISPSLARHPSSHGYNFELGPGIASRLRDTATRHLPTWLRASRRRRMLRYTRSYYQSERYVRARFGKGRLAVEDYFSLSRLGDTLTFSRALTVERMLRGEWL